MTARRCQGCDRPIRPRPAPDRCQACQEADKIIRNSLTGRVYGDKMQELGILTPDRMKAGRIAELSPQHFVEREDEHGSAGEQIERLFTVADGGTSWDIKSSNETVERAKRAVARYDYTDVGQALRGELEAMLDAGLHRSQVISIILGGIARQKAPPWVPVWVKQRTIGEMFDRATRLSDQMPQPRGAKRRRFVERELDRLVGGRVRCQHSGKLPKDCARCSATPAIIRTSADEHLCFTCGNATLIPGPSRIGWQRRSIRPVVRPELLPDDDYQQPCPKCRGEAPVTGSVARRGAVVRQHECLNAACATVFRSVEFVLTEEDAERLMELPSDEWRGAIADAATMRIEAAP